MYNPEDIAIYIHWPFCKSKCPYCDFYKELARNVNQDEIISEYLQALKKYRELTPNRGVKSVFFGGGTPSLIRADNIAKILDFITSSWTVRKDIEISLEANPNTDSSDLFPNLKNAGINRLSLGVQALNDADLRFLGRTHNAETARKCLEKIVDIFPNHSADLIYALPEQSDDTWCSQLREICSFGLKHISAYELTIEDGTVFARKNIPQAEPEKAAALTEMTVEILASHKYNRYEISNYAQTGFESRHNLTYWQGGDYIGIGKSAHGRLHINGRHIAAVYPFNHEFLSPEERAEELILMGLRLTEGINKNDFRQICGLHLPEFVNQEKLKQLKDLCLLEEDDTHVRATKQGLLLINEIVRQLCTPQ